MNLAPVPPTTNLAVVVSGLCSGIHRLCRADPTCQLARSKRPLYCLEFFKSNLRSDQWQIFNVRRADENREKLDWSWEDLRLMLLSMREYCFQKTVPNCEVVDLDGYSALDADQYRVYWNEDTKKCVTDFSLGTVSLSLKIAVISDALGILAGVVTFHVNS